MPHYCAVFLLAVYLLLRHFRNSGENVCTASNVCRATIFCYAVWLFDGSHAFRPVHNSERYISSLVAQKFSLFSECTNEYMVLCAACQVPADLTHKVALALLWCPHVCQTPPFFFLLFWSKTAVHFWPSPFLAFISSTVARKQLFLPCHIRIDFFFFWCVRVWEMVDTCLWSLCYKYWRCVCVCVCTLLLTMYRSCVSFTHSRPIFLNLLGKWWN